jgi:hypothetical protein
MGDTVERKLLEDEQAKPPNATYFLRRSRFSDLNDSGFLAKLPHPPERIIAVTTISPYDFNNLR